MSASEHSPLLRVRDLRTTFETARGTVVAVDGVSFDLKKGETLGIVGESGSGKSVLGRTIMGLVTSSAKTSVTGEVNFDGTDIVTADKKRRRELLGAQIAMVFQDPLSSLNPVKPVGTHITETLRQHFPMNRQQAKQRAIELLNTVRIPEPARRFGQYPHELSGGMRQRVGIAIALACDPKLLVADEPTTALDVTVQRHILDLLSTLCAERGMAMILVSHDLGVVAGRSDQVVVMYAGVVVERAVAADLFAQPMHPYTNGLLESIPRLESPAHADLTAIPGRPPDPAVRTAGCRFAPRCASARPACAARAPELVPDPSGRREVACFFPVAPVGAGVGTDENGAP